MKKFKLITICLLLITVGACKKSNEPEPETIDHNRQTDKWTTAKQADSAGNTYYFARTEGNTLELRIYDKEGKVLISQPCTTIDASEIPEQVSDVVVFLVSPNRFIAKNDATLSITLVGNKVEKTSKYVQLLVNINTETKKFYSKKYKVEKPQDWACKASSAAVVQWYQNTLLVKEGPDANLNPNGGFSGEGNRGTLLICYERDFTVRYTKNLDANDAYYPISRDNYIPVSGTEAIYFREDGFITKEQMVTSAKEEAEGKRRIAWRIDLKLYSKVPADYSVKLKSYNLIYETIVTTYDIFDEKGGFKRTVTEEWNVNSGFLQRK